MPKHIQWTTDKDEQLQNLMEQGMSYRLVSEALGIPNGSVYYHTRKWPLLFPRVIKRHFLNEITESTHTAICSVCGPTRITSAGRTDGRIRWRCVKTRNGRYVYRNRTIIAHKKGHCEMCGFVADHPCQLDIHHLDSNHMNSATENLQTVCANCHRLITLQGRWSK